MTNIQVRTEPVYSDDEATITRISDLLRNNPSAVVAVSDTATGRRIADKLGGPSDRVKIVPDDADAYYRYDVPVDGEKTERKLTYRIPLDVPAAG